MCFFEVAVLKITYYISKNILVTKFSKKKIIWEILPIKLTILVQAKE